MADAKPSSFSLEAEKCLQQAVKEEYQRKALLGYDVVIRLDGKTQIIPAKEALKLIPDDV